MKKTLLICAVALFTFACKPAATPAVEGTDTAACKEVVSDSSKCCKKDTAACTKTDAEKKCCKKEEEKK
ncbi:MAG: hypothetical protein LBQ31_04505 [Bacteroidales bacterium]|jgi:hypothetical protein|nr:hypothetical protein [Bacteroidales bacterium]